MAEFEPYVPVIQNPYPGDWAEITDFSYDTHLYLARAKTAILGGNGRESEYIVAAEYICSCKVDGQAWEIRVPSGTLTDLTSVPRAARLIVGRVGPHLEAAIVHDFLFVAWQDIPNQGARGKDFRFANAVMRQAMIAAGVSSASRRLILLAVSSFIARGVYNAPNPGTKYVRVPSPTQPIVTAAMV